MIFCIPCLALLLYFAILAIFMPKYRMYVKEGWRCFIDKFLGRKCSISFDNRMRLALSMWLTKMGLVKMGRFFYVKKNFDWTLIIVVVALTVLSIYLLVLYIMFQINPPCAAENATCAINVSLGK